MQKGDPVEVQRMENGYAVGSTYTIEFRPELVFETQKGLFKFLESHFRQSRKNGCDESVVEINHTWGPEVSEPLRYDDGSKLCDGTLFQSPDEVTANDSWTSPEGSTLTSTPDSVSVEANDDN